MLVGLPAVLEAVAIPVHLQDMEMVGETVDESSGKSFRAKHLALHHRSIRTRYAPTVDGQTLLG